MINKNGLILPAVLVTLLLVVLFKLDTITDYTSRLINATPEVTIDPANEYASNNDYMYVQKTTTFVPYSRQDILNIFYSILDNGYDTFTFYCPSEYTACLDDVEDISNNQTVLTNVGNFVHPFNNFTNLKVVTNSLGEVDVIAIRLYTEENVLDINSKVDEIIRTRLNDNMDIYDKILAMHDYIIDTTVYDLKDATKNSGTAYGTFLEGKAKCAGYADAMAIMLTRLGIKNYKVASAEHVWNAIYLDGEWIQIDLTWDDPVVQDGTNVTDTIRHKFYMIDTPTLLNYDTEEHDFDQMVYQELKAK